ncbi:hypothetical protein PV10_04664 [Exophiala mesophila]|uniref:EH domain-containing protein n=1 Tax=Exophiala mesophila TaxID=212818 RepID=A0A0D1XYZ7_EXOME|nr:uncharacterized protein PV10_04664 [Exophiala mesophila]KIV93451.1 hypothetical protein PV10_04664 [Exophiala mesophila]
MTETQARRPPVAPKPPFIQQNAGRNAASPSNSPVASPALRGAASAFGPSSLKPQKPVVSPPQNPSAGALAAAAAAGKKQQAQASTSASVQKSPSIRTHDSGTTARGRPLTTDHLAAPSSSSSHHSSVSPSKRNFQPHPARPTSTVAAVVASSSTSPVRRPALVRNKSGSHLSTPENPPVMRARGLSTNSSHESPQRPPKNHDALAGALASMTTGGSSVAPQKTGERPKQELGSIAQWNPQAAQLSHPSPISSPSPSGAAAAATATRNASAFEMARRTFSPPTDLPPTDTRPRALPQASSAALDSVPPSIKSTPPQTDSETDAVRYASEPSHKTLPAPVAVRPDRAAVAAQEQAVLNNNTQTANREYLKQRSINALADAMVAGSIASSHAPSRIQSPAVPPPPPKPRRRSRSVGIFDSVGIHHRHLHGPSKPSDKTPPDPPPPRTMRQTLRHKPPGDDKSADEPTKRGRKHWRRHPNMHHEGDRKRWRDKITERERKRYEGVWAANRGLFFDQDILDDSDGGGDNANANANAIRDNSNDMVMNVVVRDIWNRSRLPRDILEEVWDLVSPPGSKALNREEFVVGMWLIDQRLKGRKLPVKVSASVWSSVRHTTGVKISSKPIPK